MAPKFHMLILLTPHASCAKTMETNILFPLTLPIGVARIPHKAPYETLSNECTHAHTHAMLYKT